MFSRAELVERSLALRSRGEGWLARGELEPAADLLEASRALAEAAADPLTSGDAAHSLARAHHVAGRLALAESMYSRAIDRYRVAREPVRAARVMASLGFAAYDAGDLDRADALHARAIAEAKRLRERALAGVAEGFAANVARARGDLAAALDGYTRAIARLDPESRHVSVFRMDIAVTRALAGDVSGARRDLDRLRTDDPHLGALVEHYRYMTARLDGERLDPPSPRWPLPYLAKVREAAQAASPHRLAELRATCPPLEHGRIGVRMLDRLVPRSRQARVLHIARDGSWVALGDGPMVELRAKRAASRILLALAHATEPMTGDALVAVAWPGERILARAARNRLHVALSALRAVGLRSVLRLTKDGYRLDARVVIAD